MVEDFEDQRLTFIRQIDGQAYYFIPPIILFHLHINYGICED